MSCPIVLSGGVELAAGGGDGRVRVGRGAVGVVGVAECSVAAELAVVAAVGVGEVARGRGQLGVRGLGGGGERVTFGMRVDGEPGGRGR